ncbi:MAG: SDR family NAD(P)-dependent oxidoreductase [Pseudomonadota bacterium]
MSESNPLGGRLAGRIALVTGASRGIGAEVAKRYAKEGAQVILVARTQGGLDEVGEAMLEIGDQQPVMAPLDLRDGEMVDRLGASIYQQFGRLDVLVGNAGVLGTLSPVGHIAPKVWDETIAVNLTANWRLLRSLDPLLRQSEAGRAIFVTSGAARSPKAYWGAYAASKAALETLVMAYAAEITKTNVKANIIDPGRSRTAMRAQAYPGEDPMTLVHPSEITEAFVELATADCQRSGEVVPVY